MKGMPLPFDFEGKGVLGLVVDTTSSSLSSNLLIHPNSWAKNISKKNKKEGCFVGCTEPTSILDNISSPSPPTSTSTLSSSLGGAGSRGGGGSGCSTDVAAVSGNPPQKWPHQETSSSNVGGGGGAAVAETLDLHPVPPSLEISGGGGGAEKCNGVGLGMDDWESVLSDSVAASPGQEQSIFRWIMGDVDDPSMMGLNKVLQIGGTGGGGVSSAADLEFSGGFGVVDQGFGGLDNISSNPIGNLMGFPNKFGSNPSYNKVSSSNPQNSVFTPLSTNQIPPSSTSMNQIQTHPFDVKPHVFNPQLLINQHQDQHNQNPAFYFPLSYLQDEHTNHHENLFVQQPQPKRHNPGPGGGGEPNFPVIPRGVGPFSDTGQQQQLPFQGLPHQLQLLPPYLQQEQLQPRPTTTTMAAATKPGAKMVGGGDEMGIRHLQNQHQQQQGVIDQLFKAAELLVQSGNPILAQGILARLNHQLSPIGKPFHRAAFYFKEALQLLLLHHTSNSNSMTPIPSSTTVNSPFSLIFKIGAYKSFSEISPIVQFANFTCNQALLEVLDGFDRIHIIDFDIGYGEQWASLMQELALRSGGPPSLKITAFASPSTHDQLELGLTQENLNHFASEINMPFEFDIVSIDAVASASWSLPLHIPEGEAVAVNLPVGSFFNYQVPLPLILRFVKQLSPKIVVSVDRGCDRTDLPFPHHIIQALQSYSNLLESLDAVNVCLDALQKIERFLLQPGIEKIVMGRYRSPEKTQHWRTLFLSSGFSPLTFSNFTESQAECVVEMKRTPVRGFHVEKRQSSLVLCWQHRELISASAWRC